MPLLPRQLATLWLAALALVSLCPLAAAAADPLDWTYWRGPYSNGTSVETGLIDDWDPQSGKNVKWKNEEIAGRSTPIVMNGKLYTILRAEPQTDREGERVVCLDAETGKLLWENRFNVWLSDVPDTRVGWSSVVGDPETGRVYALGVCGYFQCLDGETGKTLWDVPLHERFGALSTYGGRTNFPIICDDVVIISAIVIGWGEMARPTHRFIGFDKMTGEVVWFNGTRPLPYDTNYSAPMLSVINGQKQLVVGSGDGAVWGFQPRTGKPIWQFQFSQRGLNVAPLVVGDRVFMGHSEENVDSTRMGSMVAIDASGTGNLTKSGQVWKEDELMVGKSSPVMIDNRLYCFDDRAKLHVLDASTGQVLTGRGVTIGRVMRASPLYADGKIYAFTANGRWAIMKPTGDTPEILAKGKLPSGDEVHGSPICSHGKIYLQTTGGLYCLEDTSKEHGVLPAPQLPQEQPADKDPQAAWVQVVPAEVLMRPGQTQKFKVRLFNSHGQLLEVAKDVSYTVDANGEIGSDGTFTAGTKPHAAAFVTAKVGELSGKARIRIVPDLPWSFDFSGLKDPPITWVGARYRHVIREVDGDPAMIKITTIPKGTRSRCWFGHSDLANYTIQADVRGASSNSKMPDIGLIAQGYTLDMMGESQALQIRSWVPQLRMAKTIPFNWKPDTWYTMKFQASTTQQDGAKVAVLRAKVWPRGQQEPQDWMLQATDRAPNLQGSPGLFGNAKDAEITLDNISVTPNKSE